jgi:hypothetical protein
MKTSRQRKREYQSTLEFEKRFFPHSFKNQSTKTEDEPEVQGAQLATESLKRIGTMIAKTV